MSDHQKQYENLKLDDLVRLYNNNREKRLEALIYEDCKSLLWKVLQKKGWYVELEEFLGLVDNAVSITLREFDVDGSFVSLLSKVFVDDFIDHLRKRKIEKDKLIFSGLSLPEPLHPGGSCILSEIEIRDYLTYMYSRIDEKSATCLQLQCDGFTYKEIGKKTGLKDVGDIIFRDRKKLQRLSEEECDEMRR